MQSRDSEPDFSEPWSTSDVIFVVEDREFHVHKVNPAMCSPVFERMFNTDFREKQAEKIPLPDKKPEEIKEFLLFFYPFAKPITESNVDFLLVLAQEYQVDKLTAVCEQFMLKQVGESEELAVKHLITAQSYNLEMLQRHCIEVAKYIDVCDFKYYDEETRISQANYSKIFEKRCKHLENFVFRIRNTFRTNLCDIAKSVFKAYSFNRSRFKNEQCLTYIERSLENEYNGHLTRAQKLLKDIDEPLNTLNKVIAPDFVLS